MINNPTEHEEQCALFEWADCWFPMVSALLFAIPMGGHRHIAVAAKLKAEGVKAGVPDIFFALPKVDHAVTIFKDSMFYSQFHRILWKR